MNDDFLSRLEELFHATVNLEAVSKKYLGFFTTITYQEILFNVSPVLVIADLSPLAFLNLVEYVDIDGAEAAAARLYERLVPLLSCRHIWIEPARPLDQDGSLITREPLQEFGHVFVCELCTAYAFQSSGEDLPVIGRSRPHYGEGR